MKAVDSEQLFRRDSQNVDFQRFRVNRLLKLSEALLSPFKCVVSVAVAFSVKLNP